MSRSPIADRPVIIDGQKAHWLDADTLAWEAAASAQKVKLFYSETASITMDEDKNVVGGAVLDMTIEGDLSDELKQRFRHLGGLKLVALDASDELLRNILKSQIVVVAYNSNDEVMAATEVQKPGVLDAVFVDETTGNAFNETLGAIVTGNDANFKVWAPTAQLVQLEIYDADKQLEQTVAMTENSDTGVWSSDVVSGVVGKYYRYNVKVYHPTTRVIEERLVTDPYSFSLSVNSRYSHVVNLDDPTLMPDGWGSDEHVRPTVKNDEDHVLYESHIRDFSFSDTLGTTALNGKYMALTEASRESVTHLQALKDAGLTTLHILPAFDIVTIDEEKTVDITDTVGDLCAASPSASVCASVDSSQVIEDLLESYDPATGSAQALMNDLRMLDSFNWGYDPYHYTVPEGSYATDANRRGSYQRVP